MWINDVFLLVSVMAYKKVTLISAGVFLLYRKYCISKYLDWLKILMKSFNHFLVSLCWSNEVIFVKLF